MRSEEWLKKSSYLLEQAGIGTARLDALVLLEDISSKDRAWWLANPAAKLTGSQLKELNAMIDQRIRHTPLAYIRGKTEFYGREFIVSPAVLEPRPESETMIELLKTLDLPPNAQIADVGTGSGALGITAALELPKLRVDLLEIDPDAINIAKQNLKNFGLKLPLIQADLLTNSRKGYDLLLCNMPYVPNSFKINLAAGHEPEIAIFGGPDGLDVYRRLFRQISERAHKPEYIFTEALPPQHKNLKILAKEAGYDLFKTEDFIQVFLNSN